MPVQDDGEIEPVGRSSVCLVTQAILINHKYWKPREPTAVMWLTKPAAQIKGMREETEE